MIVVNMENEETNKYLLPISVLISGVLIAGSFFLSADSRGKEVQSLRAPDINEEVVLPSDGVALPVVWGNLGAKLVSSGVIDADKFKAIYDQRGAFTEEYKNLLLGQNNEKLKMTKDNAGYLLNLFWALGLANKNPILDSGEMADPRYGGAGNFASTGGWTIAKGNPMDPVRDGEGSQRPSVSNGMGHYSRHMFFTLTGDQQALVDKVSRGIYRPCCGNSTHFPDCNHGMAMLGLLELMASQNVSEQDMWKAALAVNSYWFPDTYLTIASYMKAKGIEWNDVSPQEILGINYSSAQGYAKIALQVTAPSSGSQSGSGCGIDAGESATPQRQPASPTLQRGEQSGCSI